MANIATKFGRQPRGQNHRSVSTVMDTRCRITRISETRPTDDTSKDESLTQVDQLNAGTEEGKIGIQYASTKPRRERGPVSPTLRLGRPVSVADADGCPRALGTAFRA